MARPRSGQLVSLLPLLALSACSSIGDVLIPPHPRSLQGTRGIPAIAVGATPCPAASARKEALRKRAEALYLSSSTRALALPSGLTERVAGFALDQVVRFVEKEAARYSASYSARATAFLAQECSYWVVVPKGDENQKNQQAVFQRRYELLDSATVDGDPKYEDANQYFAEKLYSIEPAFTSLVFTRNDAAGTAIEIQFDLELADNQSAMKLAVSKAELRSTVAKVPGFHLWPSRWWLGSLLRIPVRALGFARSEVELSASVSFEVISTEMQSGGTAASLKKLGPYAFPLGEIDLGSSFGDQTSTKPLGKGASGYLPVPTVLFDKGYRGPVNITVSIEEANDLGDPLKKAAEGLAKRRDDLVQKILKFFDEE